MAHTRDRTITIRNILFFYDKQKRSVIVGPLKLNASKATNNVPQTLEYGGTARFRPLASKRRGGRRQSRKYISANIRPRPFMRPALAKNVLKIRELMRDSFGK